MANLRSLSGKVKKKLGSELDSDRYNFISLDNAEPDFGNPNTDNEIILSKADGTRFFGQLGNLLSYDSDTGSINVDSANIVGIIETEGFDSSKAIDLIDSAYVQARQLYLDSADIKNIFSAGTGISYNSSIGRFSIDSSADVVLNSLTTTNGLIVQGDLQVDGTTTTINTQNLSIEDNMIYLNQLESDGSPTIFVDVGWAANVNDTGTYTHVGFFRDATDGVFKLFGTYAPEPDSALEINVNDASFSYAPLRVSTITGQYLGFDSDFSGKSTTDLTEGSNLYYTKVRVDSDIVNLVDSAYVNARIDIGDITTDSAEVVQIINNTVTQTFVNNLNVDADTLDGQQGTYYLDYINFTNTPNVLDSADVSSIITADVDAAFINALTIDADTLGGQAGSYYLDYNNFINAPNVLDSADITNLVDSAYVNARVDVGTDSAQVIALITSTVDSAYVDARDTGEFTLTGSTIHSSLARSGGTNNFYAGTCAGSNNSNNGNIFIGLNAGCQIQSGKNNNILGCNAGRGLTTGSYNNFFGLFAGCVTGAGNNNNFFGRQAGVKNTASGNNFFGGLAGFCNTTGALNNFIGFNAGYYNCGGSCNNFIGYRAGRNNTNGCRNNFIGPDAGIGNTTGIDNTFIGFEAGCTNTSGSNNIVIGQGAQTGGGSNNIVLGNTSNSIFKLPGLQAAATNGQVLSYDSANDRIVFSTVAAGGLDSAAVINLIDSAYVDARDTGEFTLNDSAASSTIHSSAAGTGGAGAVSNFFVGPSAGNNTITGSHNTFIGCRAGCSNTTGGHNNFFGSCAGCSNTTGGHNNFFGYQAGLYHNSGKSNNFFGCRAGVFNTTGSCNNFFGHWAGYNNSTGSHNNFFGTLAGFFNDTGCCNNFFGRYAGRLNTTGIHNNFFGARAGCTTMTGSNNIILGHLALADSAAQSNVIVLGNTSNNIFKLPGLQASATNGQVLSYDSANDRIVFSTVAAGGLDSAAVINLIDSAYVDARDTGEFKLIGTNGSIYSSQAGNPDSDTGTNNFFAGQYAGAVNTTGSNNSFIGEAAGRNNTTGSSNVFIGFKTGRCVTTGGCNVYIGQNAGSFAGSNVSCNIAIGYNAAQYATGSVNIVLGERAGCGNQFSGVDNILMGRLSGGSLTSGENNILIGRATGFGSTTASQNIFLGEYAGRCNTTGVHNVGIGACAGHGTSTGRGNTFIGRQAGGNNTTGNYNTFIGRFSGYNITSGCNNIVIGCFTCASSATVSNEITIGNANNNLFRLPGLQATATNGQVLSYDSANDRIVFSTVAAGGGLDSAQIINLIDSDYVKLRDTIQETSTTLSTTTQTAIGAWSTTAYGGGKYLIQATSLGERHVAELLITHNGTTAVATQYADVWTSGSLATYDVDISGGNFRILATGASATSTTYKILELHLI